VKFDPYVQTIVDEVGQEFEAKLLELKQQFSVKMSKALVSRCGITAKEYSSSIYEGTIKSIMSGVGLPRSGNKSAMGALFLDLLRSAEESDLYLEWALEGKEPAESCEKTGSPRTAEV
jgi:hypothetical protein